MAVVAKVAKAIGLLGAGLRSGFSPNAKVILPALLEKMKEKKITVSIPVNETLDIFADQCFPLQEVMEDILLLPLSFLLCPPPPLLPLFDFV